MKKVISVLVFAFVLMIGVSPAFCGDKESNTDSVVPASLISDNSTVSDKEMEEIVGGSPPAWIGGYIPNGSTGPIVNATIKVALWNQTVNFTTNNRSYFLGQLRP